MTAAIIEPTVDIETVTSGTALDTDPIELTRKILLHALTATMVIVDDTTGENTDDTVIYYLFEGGYTEDNALANAVNRIILADLTTDGNEDGDEALAEVIDTAVDIADNFIVWLQDAAQQLNLTICSELFENRAEQAANMAVWFAEHEFIEHPDDPDVQEINAMRIIAGQAAQIIEAIKNLGNRLETLMDNDD